MLIAALPEVFLIPYNFQKGIVCLLRLSGFARLAKGKTEVHEVIRMDSKELEAKLSLLGCSQS